MHNSKKSLPKDCGNFLEDLPRFLGLEEPAFEKETVSKHVKSCSRCQNNFGTAREIAGAFHGIKPKMATVFPDVRNFSVEHAVSLTLRENRQMLADTFFELGKALLLDAVNQEAGYIDAFTGKKDALLCRKQGMNLANDCAVLSKENNEIKEWNEYREMLADTKAQQKREQLLQESSRYFTVARCIVPGHERSAIGLGLYYRYSDQMDAALESNHRIINESKSLRRCVEAYINSSEIHNLRKDFQNGAEDAGRAHRLDPEEPTALYNLATASLLAGDRKASFAAFESIEGSDAMRTRAQQLFQCAKTENLKEHFGKRTREVQELERMFPKTFTPAIAARILGKV